MSDNEQFCEFKESKMETNSRLKVTSTFPFIHISGTLPRVGSFRFNYKWLKHNLLIEDKEGRELCMASEHFCLERVC